MTTANCYQQIKVAFFATRLRRTGPVRQMLNMVKYAHNCGMNVRVVTLFNELPNDSIKEQFQKVIPETSFECVDVSRFGCMFQKKTIAKRAFTEINPNVIYCLGMPLYAIAVTYNSSAHVTTLRNNCFEDYPDRYGRVLSAYLCARDMRLLSRAYKSKSEYIYCCSASISKMYEANGGMRFPVIRNGVDCEEFVPAEPEKKVKARKALGIKSDVKLFVYAASFVDRKNQEFLLRTIHNTNIFNDCLFMFLGEGPKLEKLKESYCLDNRFAFTGNVSNISDYLSAADYYITSSLSEGLPNGVMEALASGLPVVMSDIPQHREIATLGSSSELFSLSSCDDCVSAIMRMLSREYSSASFEARRTAVEELSARQMAMRYLKVFIDSARDMGEKNDR